MNAIDYFVTIGRHANKLILREEEVFDACQLIVTIDDTNNNSTSIGIIESLKFESIVLSRFPSENVKAVSLPANDLPKFVFPYGLKIKYSQQKRFPVHETFSFVLTDEKGKQQYVACLLFYEEIIQFQLEELTHTIRLVHPNFVLPEGAILYFPKAICSISTQPFYRPMQLFLIQLYTLSQSALPYLLEWFIASVVGRIPFPLPGGRPLLVSQHIEIKDDSRLISPILFYLPPKQSYPFLDLDFSAPFQCLSIVNVLAVVTLILKESKIIFICSSSRLLADVMETMRALLFPLRWSNTYVSRLPHSFKAVFDSFGAFMIGFNIEEGNSVDSIHVWAPFPHDEGANVAADNWTEELSVGTYVVDLTGDRVAVVKESGLWIQTYPEKTQLISVLPTRASKRLEEWLKPVYQTFELGSVKTETKITDANESFSQSLRGADRFPTLELRDMFLVMMVELLGDFSDYIFPLNLESRENTFQTFSEIFNVEKYVEDGDAFVRILLNSVVQTQMFAYFIQRYTEGNDLTLVFFEDVSQYLRNAGLVSSSRANFKFSLDPKPWVHLVEALRLDCHVRSNGALSMLERTNKSSRPRRKGYMSLEFESYQAARGKAGMLAPLSPAPATIINNSNVATTQYSIKTYPSLLHYPFSPGSHNQLIDATATQQQPQQQVATLTPLIIQFLDIGSMSRSTANNITILQTNVSQNCEEASVLHSRGWPNLFVSFVPSALFSSEMRLNELISIQMLDTKSESLGLKSLVRQYCEVAPFYCRSISFITQNLFINAIAAVHLDIAVASLTLLSLRVLRNERPLGDLLQMVGILAELEDKGLIVYLDIQGWRAILLACCSLTTTRKDSNPLFRIVAFTVVKTLKQIGIPMNSVTYGLYLGAMGVKGNQSIQDSIVRFQETINLKVCFSQIDLFLHLEEIGLAFILQRRALDKSESTFDEFTYDSVDGAGSKTRNSSIFSWTTSKDNQASGIVRTCASSSTGNSMFLTRPNSMIGILQPRDFLNFISPFDMFDPTSHKFFSQSGLTVLCQEIDSWEDRRLLYTTLIPSTSSSSVPDIKHSIAVSSPPKSTPVPTRSGGFLSSLFSSRIKAPPVNIDGGPNITSQPLADADISFSDNESDGRSQVHSDCLTDGGDNSENESHENSIEDSNMNTQITSGVFGVDHPDSYVTFVDKLNSNPVNSVYDTSQSGAIDLSVNQSNGVSSLDQTFCGPISSPLRRSNMADSSIQASELLDRATTVLRQSVKRVIAMHSRSPCSCGYSILDEEIQASFLFNDSVWPFSAGCSKTSILDWNNTDTTITCPNCSSIYTPILHVVIYRINPSNKSQGYNLSESLLVDWEYNARYMSVREVRSALEMWLMEAGTRAGETHFMREHRPDLHWNIVWLSARTGMPAGLSTYSEACQESHQQSQSVVITDACPVVVAWREDIAQAKASKLLIHHFSDEILVSDVFTSCDSDMLGDLTSLAETFDGSMAGMRNAMLRYVNYSGLLSHYFRPSQAESKSTSQSASQMESKSKDLYDGSSKSLDARDLYLGLLYLAHVLRTPLANQSYANNSSSKMPTDETKETDTVTFYQCFTDTVEFHLSVEDLKTLGLPRKDLINCVCSESVQIARLGFGLLL